MFLSSKKLNKIYKLEDELRQNQLKRWDSVYLAKDEGQKVPNICLALYPFCHLLKLLVNIARILIAVVDAVISLFDPRKGKTKEGFNNLLVSIGIALLNITNFFVSIGVGVTRGLSLEVAKKTESTTDDKIHATSIDIISLDADTNSWSSFVSK